MKALKMTFIGLLFIAFLGFLWLRYQAVNEEPPELRIIPVAPLTLQNVQPLSRQAKKQFIEKYKYDFQFVAWLLQQSLEHERWVIRVIHDREGDSPHFARVETEAVRPVLDFIGRYAGVEFQHVAMAVAEPPSDQDALLVRYRVQEGLYESRLDGARIGKASLMEEVVVTLTLDGKEESVVGSLPQGSAFVETTKRELAERLALPLLSGRRFPFDPEQEAIERARDRALDEWRKKKGAS